MYILRCVTALTLAFGFSFSLLEISLEHQCHLKALSAGFINISREMLPTEDTSTRSPLYYANATQCRGGLLRLSLNQNRPTNSPYNLISRVEFIHSDPTLSPMKYEFLFQGKSFNEDH